MSIFGDDELEPRRGKYGYSGITSARKASLGKLAGGWKEVVVKCCPAKTTDSTGNTVMKSPHDKAGLRGLVAYMSKENTQVTDELGMSHYGHDAIRATDSWQGMRERGGKIMEVRHVIMSMPAGTPEKGVKAAVERFAADEFAGHQYLIAHHVHQNQPHAHIALKVESIDGMSRLSPRREDLQRWREGFADQLEREEIQANATSRLDRLSTRKSLSQGGYQRAKARGDLEDKLYGPLHEGHLKKLKEYQEDIEELRNGSSTDRDLAADLSDFIQNRVMSRQQDKEIER